MTPRSAGPTPTSMRWPTRSRPLIAARGFALSYDAEPSAIDGAVKVTAKLSRNGVERTASVDVPMDGQGMRGGANMSAPQAYVSTTTYGRKRRSPSCST